jgi:hypothetical protein
MIQIKKINTIDDYYDMINDQPYRPDLGRYRSLNVYRGMPRDYHLETSLERNCGAKSDFLEDKIIENFMKYAMVENPTVSQSIWRQLVLGQHHGLPTRLLDWTRSPLVAAHFATSEDDLSQMQQHDCVIWRIDLAELDELLPEHYKAVYKRRAVDVFTFAMLEEAGCKDLAQYDRDMGDHAMVVAEPPSIDPRIVNQYSFFAMVPRGIKDIEKFLDTYTDNTVKYVIDKKLRWQIRDTLDESNMSERMIYPGLDGISRWIARHYYVRRDI